MTILSRDCIENTENYRVVVEYVDTESGHKVGSFNVSFQANISIDLRKHIRTNHTIYTFQITIVEYALNVIVDKRTLSLEATEGKLLQFDIHSANKLLAVYNSPTGTNRPPTIANKRDTTDNTDNDTFFLITGSAFAALAAGIVLVVVCVCLIAMHRKKKHSTPALQGVLELQYNSNYYCLFLKFRSQNREYWKDKKVLL